MTGRLAERINSAALMTESVLRAQHGMGTIRLRRGSGKVVGRGALLGVLGDVDEHWAGASGLRDEQRFADNRSNVFRARNDVIVFRHGQSDAGNVDLLERVGAENLARNLAGDAEQRDGVKHGGSDASDHVGRAGSGGGNGHADFARGPRVAVGHVRRTLLVADENVADGEFAQRVVDGQNRAAGVAEDLAHALAFEGGPEDLGSG